MTANWSDPPDVLTAAVYTVLPLLGNKIGLGTPALNASHATGLPAGRGHPVALPGAGRRSPFPGPTGRGTSGLRPPGLRRAAPQGREARLYCPPAPPDRPALTTEINHRLAAWSEEVGLYTGEMQNRLAAGDFGRMMVMAHPDAVNPARLMAVARCFLAEYAVDDYYCEDEAAGGDPTRLPARLLLAQSAIDPAQLPPGYTGDYDQGMDAEPCRRAWRSAIGHFRQYATPSQAQRFLYTIANLYLGFNGEAGWRLEKRTPPVWEYLVHRQVNSFRPSMVVTDVAGGYDFADQAYGWLSVQRASALAGNAATLINDLYSMYREQRTPGTGYNLPELIAVEEGCSLDEGFAKAVDIHNELVHAFEDEVAALNATADPALRRYLAGLWAWMGANKEWHATNGRYARTAT